MISRIVIVAVLCVACALAEAPLNRYRFQRFRQEPSRQFIARQEAPYPESQGGEPAAEYGPPKPIYGPPTTTPTAVYGPPAAVPDGSDAEPVENTDSEVVGQPSRSTEPKHKLSLPTKKSAQKFSQRLELQQEVQHFPGKQVVTPFVAQPVVTAPLQLGPQLAAVEQDGSYFIQLSNGSIQRVNYLTQPIIDGNSVFAKLQCRPMAEPQLYVNTVVQSQVGTDDE